MNALKVDLLSVALGANKGQKWLANESNRLRCGVAAHLGATVNFFAGDVNRAPQWVQRLRLEWIWRILEEPSLFKRYWYDGRQFLRLRRRNAEFQRLLSDQSIEGDGQWVCKDGASHQWVVAPGFVGSVACNHGTAFWPDVLTQSTAPLHVDFSGCIGLSNEGLAYLLLVAKWADRLGRTLHVINTNDAVRLLMAVSGTLASLESLNAVIG